MEATELRIDNWVDSGENTPAQVLGVTPFADEKGWTMLVYTTQGTCYINEVNPIKLTDEWLVKLGFESLGLIGDHFIFHAKAEMKMSCGQFEIWRSESKHHYNIVGGFDNDFKYVHQLQNAYYALTGKELKTK